MEVAEVTGSGGSGPIEVAISESTQESSVETTKDGKKISTMSASEYQMAQMADSKVSEKDDGTTKVKVAESVQAHQEQKQSSSVKVIEQQGDGEKKSKEKKVKRKEVIIEEGKDSEKDQVVIEDVLDDEDISDDESVEVVVVKKIIRKGSKKEKKEEKKPDPEPVKVEKEEPKIEESEEAVNKARKIEVKKLEEEEVPAESKAEVRHKKDGVTIVKQIERKVSIGNILEVDHKQEVRKVIAHQKEKEKEEEKKKEAEPEEEEEEQNEDEEEEENEDAEDEAEVSEEETVKPAKKEPEETETVKVVLPAKPKAEEEPKKPEEKKVESEPEEEVEEEEEEEESSLEEVSDVEKEPEPPKPVQPPPKEAVTTSGSEIKQENIKNQIKEIISDIDKEISMAEQVKDHIETERVTAKPEQEPPVQSFRQQQFENNKENISYTSNQVSNEGKVDLQKIFTPATDAQEILPARQRKGLVKSRQDSTEQQNGNVTTSSMVSEKTTTFEESSSYSTTTKVPLKLVMDPRGQVQNIESLQRQYDLQPMSPDLCAEVVSALNESGGKGAELFAKRRKKSEKWVIDETNFNNNDNSLHQRSATTPSSHVANVPPAFTEFGQQRAQQNIKLNQIQEKYSQPRVKMVKSPWEAALETGYAQKAFEDPKVLEQQQNQHQQQFYQPPAPILTTAPAPIYEPVAPQQQQHYQPPAPQPQAQPKYVPQKPQQPKPVNLGRDLAYKPSVAQGWNAPPTNLPSEMYVPPELPLSSYAPPPKMSDYISSAAGAAPSPYSSNSYSYAPISPAPQQQQQQPQQQHYQPEPTPNLGVQYMGSAKPRTPLLSPQIVENVSPTPYSQATSSGFNTVRELKKQFSHPSAAPMPQSYPPSQQKSFIPAPSANLGASSGQKVRNRSPAPFGRHASTTTTTNTQSNTQYQQTLTKTQFHNASYAAPTFKQHPPTSAFRPQPQQQQQQQQQYHPYHKTPQNQPQSAPAFGKPSPMSPSSVPNSVPTNFGPPAGSTTSKTIIRGPSGLAAGSVVTKIDRCKNYNTAPRGWNQASDVYKPVTFSGTQPIRKTVTTMTPQFANYNNAPYTDF